MGRPRFRTDREVIEETARLTIDDLRTWGYLHEGFRKGILTLKRGDKETGSLGIEVRINKAWGSIKFDYLLNGKPVAYEHEIGLFPCHFGGRRFYFRCRNCRRHVTALYLSGRYYSCRHCLQLVYKASREHRAPFEKYSRAVTLRDRAERLQKYGHPPES